MARFEDSMTVVLRNEGGLVDDAEDKGGLTKYGLSQRTYPDLDIRNLTIDQAMAIYKRDFWKFDGITSQSVADKLMDSFVNMGHAAIRIAQQVANVNVDGLYGAFTEAAINLMPPEQFLSRFRIFLVQHYEDIVQEHPEEAKFLAGWLKRARQ